MDTATRHLAIQYAVTKALAGSTSLADASRRLLGEICGALEWQVGDLWLLDGRSGTLRCQEFWCAPGSRADAFELATRTMNCPPGTGIPGQVWSKREPVWIPDVIQDAGFSRARFAAQDGLHTAFAVPVESGGNFLGVIEFFDREIHQPDLDLLQMSTAVSAQLGQALERIRAQDLLNESEARLRGIVEGALDVVIGIDAEGRVIEWNRQAEILFGWSREEVVGGLLADTIIPERYRKQHSEGLARFIRTGEGWFLNRRIEIEAVDKSGREIPVELAITPVTVGAGYVFSAFVRDIRERRRSERRLRLLAEAGAALTASLDYEAMLARVAQLVVDEVAAHCVIYDVDERQALRRVAARSRQAEFDARWEELRFPMTLEAAAEHPAATALSTRTSVLYEHVGEPELRRLAHLPEHLQFLRSLGLQQLLCVPLITRGSALGVIVFGVTASDSRWEAQDQRLVEEIARRVAVAVENARLHRETEEAVRTRDQFITTVSHDLRTPLTAIKGLAQLLWRRAQRLATPETLPFSDSLERIDRAATKMTTLLEELLEVSGLEIGQPLKLSRARVDLAVLAREVAAAFDISAAHTIEVVAETAPLLAEVDGPRIERVLTNLLANAIKYSPSGGRVVVTVSGDGREAVLAVRDEGLGIPARDLPHVFDGFRRGSNVPESIAGTGIGLTAARQIVELHRGTIEVESVEGEGSTFRVRLPLSAGGTVGAPAEAASPALLEEEAPAEVEG